MVNDRRQESSPTSTPEDGNNDEESPSPRDSLIRRHHTEATAAVKDNNYANVPLMSDGSSNKNGNDNDLIDSNNNKKFRRRFGSSAFRRLSLVPLYNRTDEETKLLETFHRLIDNPLSLELVLVTGDSGSGKTRLAKTLKVPVETMGGYYLTAKFDQLQRPAPYSALVLAFTEFTNLVVERGDAAVVEMRKAIMDGLGSDVSILTGMIPSIESILGQEKASSEGGPRVEGSTQQLISIFQEFLRAVCSSESPMVLLFDDLHWADQGSLDVMSSIVKDKSLIEGLVVLATLPNNVSTKLHDIEDQCACCITRIEVQNLEAGSVGDLIADVLELKVERTDKLAEIATIQTGGNASKVISFLRWLHESDLLSLDNASETWRWNADDIEMTINTKKVDDYLEDELEQLPQPVKDVLQVSACLGCQLDEHLLMYVLGTSVSSSLEEAACRGVITLDESSGRFRFDHDYVLMAAYHMIPPEERELFHLELGRRLWRQLDSEEELDKHLFTLLSQMNLGKSLITSEEERAAVATLCCHAGTKAAKSSDFRTALFYLELGISLLEKRCWRDSYDLSLSLYTAAAEMALCTADSGKLNALVDEVLSHARCLTDKIGAYATRIYHLGLAGKQQEAVSLGLEVVKELGEKFPKNCTKIQLFLEIKCVRGLLKGKSDEQLIRMPKIVNKEKLSCLRILHLIVAVCLLVRPLLYPFISCRMLKLTMTYGMSNFAMSAFSSFALCETAMGNVDDGFRYGSLCLTLLDRTGAKEYLPRVYGVFYGAISPWRRPLRESMEPLLLGYKTGMQTGDIGAACICAALYSASLAASGVPLDEVEREFHNFEHTISSNRIGSLVLLTAPIILTLRFLRGSTLTDCAGYDESIQNTDLRDTAIAKDIANLNKLMSAYIFIDYDVAAGILDELQYWNVMPGYLRIRVLFFVGAVALARAQQGHKVWKHTRLAKKIIRRFRRFSRLSPQNTLGMLFLLQAELASLQKQNDRAFEKYTASLAMLRDMGILGLVALTNERAARHFLSIGDRTTARQYFDDSLDYYKTWGALAKLQALEEELNSLYK